MSEFLIVTPADLLVAFAVQVVLIALAMAGTWWAVRPPAETQPPVECAETVELPRGHTRPRRTGTIHAGQYDRAGVDAPTQPLRVDR
ncbi:hypothetical protein ACFYUR_12385 [Micromonospora haikouensis]|uniref:hypothetical protein n=1 Tax=Micromonospora haikouensis TaxID=686309 RepID=UPI00368706E4